VTTPPPTREDLIGLFERVTPSDFYAPLREDIGARALIRSIAEIFAVAAEKGNRSLQASYFLPYALQTDEPASSSRRARGDVTLRRGDNTTPLLVALPGEMLIDGPGGRVYTNTSTFLWYPQSLVEELVVTEFAAVVPGYASNLEFLADADGNLPLDRIEVANQSLGRANDGGSVVIITAGTAIQDDGFPDLFTPQDVGLYVRINQAASPENVGRLLKIVGFDFPEEELPPGSGLYPRRVFVDTNLVQPVREAYQEDASTATLTDITADVLTRDLEIAFFPDPAGLNDSFIVASSKPLAGILFDTVTAADADWTLTWEYENGGGYAPLNIISGNGAELNVPGPVDVRWEVPADYALVPTPSGISWYLTRVRISALTSVTTPPTFRNLFPLEDAPLVPENGTITWSIEDFGDLGVSIVESKAFIGGTDDNLRLLGDGRQIYQQEGESDDEYRQRVSQLLDTVSPNAILRVINRALAPFGFEGKAIDVSNGLTGAFCDVDFFDNYSGGDPAFAQFDTRLVATANVNLAIVGLPGVIDGEAVNTGDSVLLTAQANPVENGAWIFRNLLPPERDPAWGFGGGATALNGITAIAEGASFAETTWIVNAGNVIGVDPLVIDQLIQDAFPEDPWILNLSIEEAYGFFLVLLPFLGEGEFGAAFDEGPILFLDDVGLYISGFMDNGFFDKGTLGSPSTYDTIYSSIYSSIEAIRAGGVGFTLVRDETLNVEAGC